MDYRNSVFEWSPGHRVDDNEKLILEEDNENIGDDKETNGEDNEIQSQ